MNEFQLGHLFTPDLIKLRNAANNELKVRRRQEQRHKRSEFAASLKPVQTKKSDIEIANCSSLLAIPHHKTRKINSCSPYFPSLIKQDWGHLYNGGDKEEKYYVYVHVDQTKSIFVTTEECGGNYGGQPFYVGKGTGERAFDLNRNQGHGKVIKSLLGKGLTKSDIVRVVFQNLTEAKAFEIESKLIYFFGTIYDKQIKKQGCLYNLEIPKLPEFVGEMTEFQNNKFSGV
jgi:hypothetical protein